MPKKDDRRCNGVERALRRSLAAEVRPYEARFGDVSRHTVEEAIAGLLRQTRENTGNARRCGAFLLSLADGERYKVDLQNLLYADVSVMASMLLILAYLNRYSLQLGAMTPENELNQVADLFVQQFRAEIRDGNQERPRLPSSP